MSAKSARMVLGVLLGCLILGRCSGPAGAQVGPTALKAFWREGQTFLTWKEDEAVRGEWYRVYVAAEPVTSNTLAKAKLIARIPEGSNRFGFFRNLNTSGGFFKSLAAEPWAKAIQIEDDENGAKQLPDGTGLFVRTIKQPGKSYYAVTLEKDGKEARNLRPGVSSLSRPVDEQVAVPRGGAPAQAGRPLLPLRLLL